MFWVWVLKFTEIIIRGFSGRSHCGNNLSLYRRTMIQNMIKEGKIVPAEVTVKLLQKAMEKSDNDKFLIDGFPRNDDNRKCFEDVVCSSSFMQLCF